MPKLCQCRRKKLLDRLWDIPDPYKDLVDQQLEDIEKILESDCVCEKKEVCSCRYHNDVCVGAPQRNGVCGLCPPNCLEKQSQSPCEHEPDEWNIYCKKCGYTFKKECEHSWEEKKVATYPYYGEDHVVVEDQWWCLKCGLVTCLNPNQE